MQNVPTWQVNTAAEPTHLTISSLFLEQFVFGFFLAHFHCPFSCGYCNQNVGV